MIDPTILNDLRVLGDDDETFFKKLMQTFLQTIQERLPAIEEAVQLKSPEKLSTAAHALKSSSYNLGANIMGDLCAELEKCGKTSAMATTPTLLQQLRSEVTIVREEVSALPEMAK